MTHVTQSRQALLDELRQYVREQSLAMLMFHHMQLFRETYSGYAVTLLMDDSCNSLEDELAGNELEDYQLQLSYLKMLLEKVK